MSLIVFHELGHFIAAKIYNWKIERIYIYPLGGITKFNDNINKPVHEEIIITIMGPIFQIILTILFIKLNIDKDVYIFSKMLLLFNLLPIVPLDGSKLITTIISIFKPYKKTLEMIIKVSYLSYIFMLYFLIIEHYSLYMILIFILLLFKIIDEKNNITNYFNKFIFERCINNYLFKKTIIIYHLEDMYKYKNNIIKRNNTYIIEKDLLRMLFKEL